MMTKFLARTLGVIMFGFTVPAYADTNIETIPTAWRLQNYAGNEIAIWFAGSPCVSGKLSFNSSMTTEDRNRFFALVMTAKINNQPIGVYYETVTPHCYITSFYMLP